MKYVLNVDKFVCVYMGTIDAPQNVSIEAQVPAGRADVVPWLHSGTVI